METSQDRTGSGRKRRLFSALAVLVFAAILLALFLASITLDRFLPEFIELDGPTTLTLPPNLNARIRMLEFDYALRTNALGLRTSRLPTPKTAGARRILFLGDSQTAGVGVEAEQAFAALLEMLLENAETVNCGVPGAHLLAQAKIFRHVGLRYEPDVLVLCVSADDLADIPTYHTGGVFDVPAERPADLRTRFWPNFSAALEAARQRRNYARTPEPFDFVARTEQTARNQRMLDSEIERWKRAVEGFPKLVEAADARRLDPNAMAFGLLWKSYWADSLDAGPWRGEVAWGEMSAVLSSIACEAAAQDVGLAVVFIPARLQYDRSHLELLKTFGHHVVESWLTSRCRFETALGRWCGDRGVPFLSLTEAFRGHESPGDLSFTFGGQLTPAGHRLVAERLAPWLGEFAHARAGL